MKYKIDWIEKGTTSTGKVKADATLSDAAGKYEVTIWGDFPGFANLLNGGEVEGEIKPASDPKYKPSLNTPRVTKTSAPSTFKQKMIEDTMIKKEQSIGRFQDSKEFSIKVSSTFRAAVDSAIAEYQEQRRVSIATEVSLEKLFEKWREFYWFNFDVDEAKKYPPFK